MVSYFYAAKQQIMKKLLTTIFALGTTSFALLNAQITLTDQHFSTANESYIFSTLTDPTIDFASTGAGYTWNFGSLTPTSQRTTINQPMSSASQLSMLFFGSFAPTEYKATYFGSTTDIPIDQLTGALPVTIDDINQFTRKTSSKITSVGFEFILSGNGIPAKSDTIETRYELPLTYGDAYSSNGYTRLDLNPIYDGEWRQHRTRNSNVDGWGTITTPFGTFQALRIHHVITEIDSLYVTAGGTGFWIPLPIPTAHEYEWRAMEEKEPVMRIKTNDVAGQEVVSSIEYRDNYNGLGIEEASVSSFVGPNPMKDQLNLQSNEELINIMIIDASGKIVFHDVLAGHTYGVNVANFTNGIYTVVVETSAGTDIHKVVKQ